MPTSTSNRRIAESDAMAPDDGTTQSDGAFTLFEDEDRVLVEADALLKDLDRATGHVKDLQKAYKRAVRDQKRMVRLCDRMQGELLEVKERLELEVVAREELAEKFRKMAVTDALTGAASRRHFLELCGHELSRRERSKAPLAILLLDVDHFKKVNDTRAMPR